MRIAAAIPWYQQWRGSGDTILNCRSLVSPDTCSLTDRRRPDGRGPYLWSTDHSLGSVQPIAGPVSAPTTRCDPLRAPPRSELMT